MPLIDPVTGLFIPDPSNPDEPPVYLPPFPGGATEDSTSPEDRVIAELRELKALHAAADAADAARAAQQAVVDGEVAKLAALSVAATAAHDAIMALLAKILADVKALD